jgi:molecular chaperone Hsp33
VQLYTSEIAEDLAYYLTTSEQTPSSVALGVSLAPDGSVAAAGGFLVQAMPGGDESLIPLLEVRLATLPPVSTLLRDGLGPAAILEHLFAGIPFSVKGETELVFRCGCSRQQVRRVLLALGKEELQQLAAREESTRVTCEFCEERYDFVPAELKKFADLL